MTDFVKQYIDKTPGSSVLYERAAKVMPGGVAHNHRYFPPYPLYIKDAAGSKIWDVDNNEYIDLWMGHYTHILGYQAEPIVKSLKDIMLKGTHWGFVNEYQIDFAEDICRIMPCAEKVRFGVSGTEAQKAGSKKLCYRLSC